MLSMARTRPGPTPVLGEDGGLSAKVLPIAPVTRVVSMIRWRTGGHPRAELEAELLEMTGAAGAVEVKFVITSVQVPLISPY